MDTATQALLGAVVGQACFSHKLGRRAVAWGAVGGLLPDLDVLAVLGQGPLGEFVHHRGFTHALWFGPLVGPLLGASVWRYHARRLAKARARAAGAERGPSACAAPPHPGDPLLRTAWMGLFALALFTHPLIDVFTSYGTQLFAPFSNQRYALHAVGIIDVTYSGILVAALALGRALRGNAAAVRRVAWAALALSWAYLGYGLWLNERARDAVTARLAADGVSEARVQVYPTLLQPYLRRIVVRSGDEVWVGLYTPWREGGPAWQRFRQSASHPSIDALMRTREAAIFVWFAMGEVATRVRPLPDGYAVEIDDLRYGHLGLPERGLWGIRGITDRSGSLRGPIEIVTHRGSARLGETFGALWRAAWGDFSGSGFDTGH